VNVVPPSLLLDFWPDGMDISPSGKLALLWSAGNRSQRDSAGEGRAQLALVDLKAGKVLLSRKLAYQIQTAALDDSRVYVAPLGASRVEALNKDDFSRDTQSVTDAQVKELRVLSPKLLGAAIDKGKIILALPDLKPVTTAFTRKLLSAEDGKIVDTVHSVMSGSGGGTRMGYDRGSPGLLPVKLEDGWYAGGCVFGPELGVPRILVQVSGLPIMHVDRLRIITNREPWARVISQAGLMSVSGNTIAQLQGGSTILLTDYPLAATLNRQGQNNASREVVLTLRELVSGDVVARVMIARSADGRNMDEPGLNVRAPILATGRDIIILMGNRLFQYTVSDDVLSKCAKPFAIETLAEVPTLDPAKTMQIMHKVEGGTAPFQFDLSISAEGVSIDQKTGVVTLDGPVLYKAAEEMLLNVVRQIPADGTRGPGAVDAKTAASRLGVIFRGTCKEITGIDVKGIPVLIPMGVTALDKEQHLASLDYCVLVDVSEDKVVELTKQLVARLQEEAKARQDAVREEQKRFAEEMAKRQVNQARVAAPNEIAAMKQRIDALDKTVQELNGKIDVLLKLLKDKK